MSLYNELMEKLPIIFLMVLVTYFFFLRPDKEEKKKKENFFLNLKMGQWIVTIGGIHGRICDIREECIVIALDEGPRSAKICLEKEAISLEATQRIYPIKEKKKAN